MPANGSTSSAKRTAGADATCTGSARKPVPATAATVRKGAIHRATAPAAENFTPGKLMLQIIERQSPSAGDGAIGAWHGSGVGGPRVAVDLPGDPDEVGDVVEGLDVAAQISGVLHGDSPCYFLASRASPTTPGATEGSPEVRLIDHARRLVCQSLSAR